MKITFILIAITLFQPFFSLTADTPDSALSEKSSKIRISGTVAAAEADSFQLEVKGGMLTVLMNDWDWYSDSYKILSGDNVMVYGRVEDELYESSVIEATSVFVKKLNTYFYANDTDEEDVSISAVYTTSPWVEFTGTVTSVSGREFTLDTDRRMLTVDTSDMAYNPLDDTGYQQVEAGDRVQVAGEFESELLEEQKLLATSVITLTRDERKSSTN